MSGKISVLIVMDDGSQTELIARELQKGGLLQKHQQIRTSQELKKALAEKPDLIISGYMCLGLTYAQVLKAAREHNLDVPVLIVTGGGNEEIAVECLKAGAADYIPQTHLFRLAEAAKEALMKLEADRRQKRSEKALHFTKFAVDHAALAIYWLNTAGRVVGANEAAMKLLGYSLNELSPLHISQIDPRMVPSNWDLFLKKIRASLSYSVETRHRCKKGQVIPVEWTANLFQIENQEYILVFAHDITKRKIAEEEHQRLVIAIEQAAESIMITGINGKIVYINPACERLSGYTKAELIGNTPGILKSGKHSAEFYQSIWSTLTNGESWHGHFINKRKDGALYEEEATISPIKDKSGNIINFVAVKRDVTHEVDLEKQIYQSKKMEAIGRLAGGVAHDFNNLLTIINGYSELTFNELKEGDPLRANLEQILKACQRASGHTRQLLAFSRRQPMERKVLDLNSHILDMDKMIQRLVQENVQVITKLGKNAGNIKADPAELDQIIVNLITNAGEAMPHGGKLVISTGNMQLDEKYCHNHIDAQPGQYLLLTVQDTGQGMSDETRSKIFEPFFTTKDSGTGLGLSMVFGIVKQHGGHIECYSEPNIGATFRIFLPLVQLPAENRQDNICYDQLPRGFETILLVEDEEVVCGLATRMLTMLGYNTMCAQHGGEALLLCEKYENSIDLLLTDVVMPQMSGPELAKRMRKIKPELKVLYTSGYPDSVVFSEKELDQQQQIALIPKPFTLNQIAHKVREVLDGVQGN